MNEEEMRAYKQRYFQEHKDHMNALSKIQAAERRAEIHELFEELKQGKACQGCGITDTRLLEFRCKNPKNGKKANLKNIAISSKWGEKRIRQELEKASLLCGNCWHSKTHTLPE